MSVPKFFEFFDGFLNAIKDGEIHSAKEVREIIAQDMNISESDRNEMLQVASKVFLIIALVGQGPI